MDKLFQVFQRFQFHSIVDIDWRGDEWIGIMSVVQRQDFVVFADRSVISSQVYNNGLHNMITITSSRFTSPTWLINSLVESQVLGKPYSLNADRGSTETENRPVTVASFAHEKQHFTNALGKLKVDSRQYKVVDLVTDMVIKMAGKSRSKIYAEILEQFPSRQPSVILLEQPELLLALLDGATSDEVHSKLIKPLMRRCSILIVATNIYTDDDDVTEDAHQFRRFTVSCFYKSMAVMSLRPLETGRAADVTGLLRISRGGAPCEIAVQENEYLYLNQKEATRLFYR